MRIFVLIIHVAYDMVSMLPWLQSKVRECMNEEKKSEVAKDERVCLNFENVCKNES